MAQEGNRIELSGIFSEGYGIIPKKLMRSKLKIHEKAVLAYMLSYTGGGCECFPSYERIAADMQISKSTVAKIIKKITESGYIRKERLYPNDPMKHNNKYVLTFLNGNGNGNGSAIVPHAVPSTVREADVHSSNGGLPLSATRTSNNNIINNNRINNKCAGAEAPAATAEYHAVLNAFKSVNSSYDTVVNHAKEGKAIKTLLQKAGGSSGAVVEWIESMKSLKESRETAFWQETPLIPSALLSRLPSVIEFANNAQAQQKTAEERYAEYKRSRGMA